MTTDRPEVLFLCVHNAGRSQMAAALLHQRAEGRIVVHSAGSDPGEHLNPAVVAALAEWDIDIGAERPKRLTDTMARSADVIVTMGCGDRCPVYPGKRYVDWELPDPAGLRLEQVRPIRDEIDRKVQELISQLDSDRGTSVAAVDGRGADATDVAEDVRPLDEPASADGRPPSDRAEGAPRSSATRLPPAAPLRPEPGSAGA